MSVIKKPIKTKASFNKQKILEHLHNHRLAYASFVIIFCFGLALLHLYRYQINPDGVAYIGIAQKYANGDFRHAVNGYWGPLLSWLMVPGLLVSIDPIITIKFIQLLVVIGIMALAYLCIKDFVSNRYLVMITTLLLGLVGIRWAFAGPLTPDLIVCLLSLVLVYLGTKQLAAKSFVLPVLFGVLGALLYFSKSVGLYLFLGTWLVCALLQHIQFKQRKLTLVRTKDIKFTLASLITCFVLIIPFVAAISLKYHQPTIGTSGSYNFALVGPHTVGHPVTKELIQPPNPTAVSAWEDTSTVSVVSWKPFESISNAQFFFKNVYKNILFLNKLIGLAFWFLIPLALLFFVSRDSRKSLNQFKVLALSLAILNVLAYLPIFVEERYVYFVFVTAIIGSTLLVSLLPKSYRLFSFVLIGVYVAVAANSLLLLRNSSGVNRDLHSYSETLQPYLNSNTRIASDSFGSLFACYYTNAKCIGVINSDWPDLAAQLQKNQIQYLLLYPSSADNVKARGIQLEHVNNTYYEDQFLYEVTGL